MPSQYVSAFIGPRTAQARRLKVLTLLPIKPSWKLRNAIQKDGTKKSRKRPEAEWIKIEAPELRLVPEAVTKEVDKRLTNTRVMYMRSTGGKLFGHPSGADLRSTYLLSGIAMCAWCEGSLVD